MSLKQLNLGDRFMVDTLTANWGSLSVHLYTNNHVPADSDTAGSFTEINPAVSTWYASQIIASWGAAGVTSANHYGSVGSSVSWTYSGVGGTVDIYGYYVTNGAGVALWAEYFAGAPITLNTVGQVLTLTPVYTQTTEF